MPGAPVIVRLYRCGHAVVTEVWRGHKLVEARLGYASDN